MLETDVQTRCDQDVMRSSDKTPHKPGSATSQRLGSVWGSKQDVRSSDSQNNVSDSPTSQFKSEHASSNRKAVATWLQAILGKFVPSNSDQEFRKTLSDGVILCEAINIVAQSANMKSCMCQCVEEAAQGDISGRFENVQNFIKAAEQMGVPREYMFNVADLDHSEDRLCVVNCLLWLKLLHDSNSSDVTSKAPSPQRFTQPPLSARSNRPVQPASYQQQDFQQPQHSQHSQRSSNQNGGMGGGATGVTKLMQECTVLLKAKMSYSSNTAQMTPRSSDAFSFDAVGPVLESVLGGLTQEYERRLHAKDSEIIATTEKMNLVSRQMEAMQSQLRQLKDELAQQQEAAAANASQASAAQNEEMQARLQAMAASLEERERLYKDIEARLGGQHTKQDDYVQELEQQLAEMSAQIEDVQSMQLKYREVQEENRKFYNMIQDLKGAIRVYCRIRPLGKTGDSSETCINVAGDNELATYNPRGLGQVYKFDKVFRESTMQDQIYADTQPLVRSVLDGFNVCIFAYGQTGSGKTHTMSGTDIADYSGRGINYRALDDLFQLRDERASEVTYEIKTQMLEIYNESLRDLLVHKDVATKLDILSTQASGCNVPNATKATVQTPEDVLQMMAEGSQNRHSAETKMNERSSRSHQVLTVIVDGYNRLTGARTHGCLHLVDLAGSERNDKSEAKGDRLVEANYINSSLSALGDVMAALANKQKHVPFRNSKLTQLLADSLSGQAKVMMFMHIAPEATSFQETTSTLKFATRVNEITLGAAKKNVESGEVHKVHEELLRVKQQLAKEREEKEAALAMVQSIQYDMQRQQGGSITPYQSAASHGSEQKPPRTPSFNASPLPRAPPFTTPLSNIHEGAYSRASADGTPMSARGLTPNTAQRNPLQRSGSMTARCGSSYSGTSRNLAAEESSTTPVRSLQKSQSSTGSRLPGGPASSIPRPSTAACDSSPGGSMSARPSARYGGTPAGPSGTPPPAPSLMPPPSARGLPSYCGPTASSRTSAPSSTRTSGIFGGAPVPTLARSGSFGGAPISSRTSGTFGGPPSSRTSGTYGGLARSSSARQAPEPASAGGRRASSGAWSMTRR